MPEPTPVIVNANGVKQSSHNNIESLFHWIATSPAATRDDEMKDHSFL